MKKAAFLDRDGVLNIDHAYVHAVEDFEWVDGALASVKKLSDAGFIPVIVTNQSGIGRGYYSEKDFQVLTEWMCARFEEMGAPIAGVYFCPHHPEKALPEYRTACQCRKPAPGMLLRAAKELGIDLSQSVMFGDKSSDVTAGRLAGCPERILLGTDGKALPTIDAPDATRRFRNLSEAVESPWFQAFSHGENQ